MSDPRGIIERAIATSIAGYASTRGEYVIGGNPCANCAREPGDANIRPHLVTSAQLAAAVHDALAGLLVQPGTETRTWSLPPEPGPEVKAVRTDRGETWCRGTGYFAQLWTRKRTGVVGGIDTRTWLSLLREGPLTDATQEAQ